MLLYPSLRPLGGTRIWTQNSKYRMKLKGTISKTHFIPPCPSTLLLTLKQPDQLCARSDITGGALKKIQQYCKKNIYSNNYKEQSVPIINGFNKFSFFFLQNYQKQGLLTEGKEKEEVMTRR